MDVIVSTTLILNVLLGLLMLTLALFLIDIIYSYQKEQNLYGVNIKKTSKNHMFSRNKYSKRFYRNVSKFYTERHKEQYIPYVFYGTFILAFAIFIYFVSLKQVLFAVLIPLTLFWITNKVFNLLLVDVNEKIDEQLPNVIDTIIKVFSKYGDLKSVIHDTSQSIDGPLKEHFEQLSRKMISESPEKAIMEFADEMDNIWIHSLVFILLSHLEDSKKEDVIANLRNLASIIEKENSLNSSSVTDKQYGVVLNYVIAILAVLAGIANIMFNPMGKDFFFNSLGGILCFIIGMGAVIFTILINIKLTSKKRKGGRK